MSETHGWFGDTPIIESPFVPAGKAFWFNNKGVGTIVVRKREPEPELDPLTCPIEQLSPVRATPIHDELVLKRRVAEVSVAIGVFADHFREAMLRASNTANARIAAMTSFLSGLSLDELDALGGFSWD